jgi:hypothetical protein
MLQNHGTPAYILKNMMSPPIYSWTSNWRGNECIQGDMVGCIWHFPVFQRLNYEVSVTELLDIQMQKQVNGTLHIKKYGFIMLLNPRSSFAQIFLKLHSQCHEFCLIINNHITSRILGTYQSKFWVLPTSHHIKPYQLSNISVSPHSTRSKITLNKNLTSKSELCGKHIKEKVQSLTSIQ